MIQKKGKEKIVMIIGNGFDLNLGLETSYNSFINSKEFNELTDKGSKLANYLLNKSELKHWIDIENELKEYSNKVFKDPNREPFKQDYVDLCNNLCLYLNKIDYSIINKESKAYSLFCQLIKKDADIYIYDFNYTESISKIIEDNDPDKKAEIHLFKVHGSAADNHIVFGVEDNAYIDENDAFLYKSASHYYNFKLNINVELNDSDLIVVMGHSLGETDHFYFQDFFRRQYNSTSKGFLFTYYTEKGWYNMMKQLQRLTLRNLAIFRSNNNIEFKEI